MRHSSADSFVQSQKKTLLVSFLKIKKVCTAHHLQDAQNKYALSDKQSHIPSEPVTRYPWPVTRYSGCLCPPLSPLPVSLKCRNSVLQDSTPEHIIIKRVNKDIPVICLEDDSDETDVLRPEQLNSDLSAETETSDKKKHGRKKTVSRMNENFHAVQSKPQAHLSHLKLEFPSRRHPTCEFRTIHKWVTTW